MGNGYNQLPPEIMEVRFPYLAEPLPPPRKRPLWPALILFFLTVLSTLAVGAAPQTANHFRATGIRSRR
jgi:hypothetical protein